MNATWYARRLQRMSAGEILSRSMTAARQWWWTAPAHRPAALRTLLPGPRTGQFALTRSAAPRGPAADAVVQAARDLLAGRWRLFHLPVDLPQQPDWFRDPLTGVRAPRAACAFHVPHRDEAAVGNIKFVWELSRHQPATLLACAWWLTGEDAFAALAASHLQSWWRDNPFLQGVHWVSGIEAGLRLLSWSWMRALLHDWPGVRTLFDGNPVFAGQLYHHSRFVHAFRSTGSSANNHVIAELAGLAAASTVFPWFRQSAGWAARSSRALARQAVRQTHDDGWNREQASSYHMFVLEMLVAVVLLRPDPVVSGVIRRMADALAATLDSTGQPPRFGDSDDARGLLVDAPDRPMATGLLDAARVLTGGAAWWPADGRSVLGHIAATLAHPAPQRSLPRPALFRNAGIVLLRSGAGPDEIWLRGDTGPHGFLSIAAHGHADALSVELRAGGTEVLADPGTYCYHGQPAWRALFRGTVGHNTLMVDGQDQAEAGGPFLWLTRPATTLHSAGFGETQWWDASHDGYRRLRPRAVHRRRVLLCPGRRVVIQDRMTAARGHPVRLAFHLGPLVDADINGIAQLRWPGGAATMSLPGALRWQLDRGVSDPPAGWYSRGFGQREPAYVLAGTGILAPGHVLTTMLDFA